MKLRNKKTGDIVIKHLAITVDNEYRKTYSSLAELNEDWEDYKEPKGIQDVYNVKDYVYIKMSSEEEAVKAVEKLKAWKRLKDKGFQFESWFGGSKDISFWLDTEIDEDIAKDLDLLFRGEE